LGMGPLSRRPRHGIEPLEILKSGTGAIVIAAHDGERVGPHPIDDLVWVGAVTRQVAQTKNAVKVAGSRIADGSQGFPVRVQIAEYEIAQKAFMPFSSAPRRFRAARPDARASQWSRCRA